MKKFNISKEELFELFIIRNMTRIEVANYYKCSCVLIKKKCQEYEIKKPKYLENKNKERKIEKNCLYCNTSFKVIPLRYEGKWEQKFCSQECSQKFRFLGTNHKRKVLNAIAAKRRCNMKNASIELTIEERIKIKGIYLNCPDGYEVDHVIPISKGGKHHPDNLQYLTVAENRRKHNK